MRRRVSLDALKFTRWERSVVSRTYLKDEREREREREREKEASWAVY